MTTIRRIAVILALLVMAKPLFGQTECAVLKRTSDSLQAVSTTSTFNRLLRNTQVAAARVLLASPFCVTVVVPPPAPPPAPPPPPPPAPVPPPTPPPSPPPAPPPSGSFMANRPAGLTTIAELDFGFPIPGQQGLDRMITGHPPWGIMSDNTWSAASDASAPTTGPGVWRITYRAGMCGGCGSVGHIGIGTVSVSSELYVAVVAKWDQGFEFHSVSNKFLIFGGLVFHVQARHFTNYLRASDEGIGQGYDPQVNRDIADGQWHKIEVYAKRGNPGIVRIWVDGELRTNYTTQPVQSLSGELQLDTTYGGSGPTIYGTAATVAPHNLWLDHIVVAGR